MFKRNNNWDGMLNSLKKHSSPMFIAEDRNFVAITKL